MTLNETVLFLDKNPANAQLSKEPLPALKQSNDKAGFGFMKGIFVNEYARAATVILQKYQGDDAKLPTPELACRRAAANGFYTAHPSVSAQLKELQHQRAYCGERHLSYSS